MTQKAYLGGGCFWGLEELFRSQKGIVEITAGYCGGKVSDLQEGQGVPTYEHHKGFAEALEIVYDDTLTDFWHILDFFFQIHNPTTLNRQGNDIGDSYRSVIFFQSEGELEMARKFIDIVNASKRWNDPVVTTCEPFEAFFKAEEYHQDYLQKNPGGYTCHAIYFDSYLV